MVNARLDIEQRHQELAGQLQQLQRRLRPGQRSLAEWSGGPLAVSAVPGAGKSTGMAIATAILLGNRYLQATPGAPVPDTQIVLVTFTRSAAANLRLKVRQTLQELGLPISGFAVYTLHGLALNIASRHPDLSGLTLERLTLISPNQSHRLIRTSVEQWIAANPSLYQPLVEGMSFDGEETERLRRQSVLRTEILPALAHTAIREAKSSGLSAAVLRQAAKELEAAVGDGEMDYDLLAIAAGLYENYQELLQQRQFIDYDDMILAALRVLDDEAARQIWQGQIYAVFEDEAQDSSPLQTRLLEILATQPTTGAHNLVRVGDPNQAINSTFTPADPIFFREFCAQCQNQERLAEMDQAGRSSPIIFQSANFMLDWVNQRCGTGEVATTEVGLPFRSQHIYPVPNDDPQSDANPAPIGEGVEVRFPPDPIRSVTLIAQRVATLFRQDAETRMAVLVRENRQGKFVADVLRSPQTHGIGIDLEKLGLDLYEVGERDRHSHIPAEIYALLQFLERPHSPDYLKSALRVLVSRQLVPSQDLNPFTASPEQVLFPGVLDPPQEEPVQTARRYCNNLLRARLELPPYQLIPFLALTLGYTQTELATADKLAARISRQTTFDQSLASILAALGDIVRAERFEPVQTDTDARYTRPGQLTIMTMHKAKGLDWDVVFLPFLQEDMIPGKPWIPPQGNFLGEFSPAEVARAQIRALVHQHYPLPAIADATLQADYLKLAEEYRLLYVAMTRARRLLWMAAEKQAPFSWQNPDNLQGANPSPVVTALYRQLTDVGTQMNADGRR
ncbi:ATP-dependent helicase [Vacuolonema iberomarrocanum]|uniref:ATP-dependent helicase n=1 Tax=Vacuolonema iberomarrocanum TaxID=3454632 RepID=UPI0019DF63B3|nr:ATP-dependent helicase [filamentous cyanobacterium LEGE 07170]